MSGFTKADGAKIKITFDSPITTIEDGLANVSAFVVTVPEYNYVPEGTIRNVVKTLASVTNYSGYCIILETNPLERFASAAGDISVSYAGGTLMGVGGPVAPFTETFTPEDLEYKGDQNDAEHINVVIQAVGNLVSVDYSDYKAQNEHINLNSITASGILTHINDL